MKRVTRAFFAGGVAGGAGVVGKEKLVGVAAEAVGGGTSTAFTGSVTRETRVADEIGAVVAAPTRCR